MTAKETVSLTPTRHIAWSQKFLRLSLMGCLIGLVGSLPLSAEETKDKSRTEEGQVTFEGSWRFEGHRVTQAETGESLFRTEGEAMIETSKETKETFTTHCVGAGSDQTGSFARCVWTTKDGSDLVVELNGRAVRPKGTLREEEGRIVGGSGRFAGAEGKLEMSWLFIDSAFEEGKVVGTASDITGVFFKIP